MCKDKNMNIKIQNASPKEDGGKNTGSCAALATYLEHEDDERRAEGKEAMPFLTPDGTEVTKAEVIDKIDRNHARLGKNDYKFYALTVAPSKPEIQAMGETEREQYESGLKLMRAISDSYAQSFHKEGIDSADDLVLFWKFHFTRGDDGDLQFHMHAIVSRKSRPRHGKSLKLSPLTSHRHTETGPVKGGFDRTAFFEKGEKLFDQLFAYDRKVAETFAYQNAMAHGTPEEKAEQVKLLAAEKRNEQMERIKAGLGNRRENLKQQSEVEEVADLLSKDNVTLPVSGERALEDALEFADVRTIVPQVFAEAKTKANLSLNLAAKGVSCRSDISPEGVEDLVFVKGGKKVYARELFDTPQLESLLDAWEKFTGEKPAAKTRAEREVAKQKEELEERKLKLETDYGITF